MIELTHLLDATPELNMTFAGWGTLILGLLITALWLGVLYYR